MLLELVGSYEGNDGVELEAHEYVPMLLAEIFEGGEALLHNDGLELGQEVSLRQLCKVFQTLHLGN